MFNRAILMGRICNDLELKTVQSGISVLSFRLAVDRSYQAKGEERKTDFFNIVAWRSTAEFISRYFSKGRMILVEGELQTRKYTKRSGIGCKQRQLHRRTQAARLWSLQQQCTHSAASPCYYGDKFVFRFIIGKQQ